MINVATASDLQPYIGSQLGLSRWELLDEARVHAFGRLTGDTHWIHMDDERARRETTFGGALVHGFLVLSLITELGTECFDIADARQWLNYGLDRLRFTAPVRTGSRVRLREELKALDLTKPGSARITVGCTVELEGSERPALVTDRIMVALW